MQTADTTHGPHPLELQPGVRVRIVQVEEEEEDVHVDVKNGCCGSVVAPGREVGTWSVIFDGTETTATVSAQFLDTRGVPSDTSEAGVAQWFDDGDDGSGTPEAPRLLQADTQVCCHQCDRSTSTNGATS